MTRLILAALAAFIAIAVLSGTGCNSTGVGDPCIPEQEYLTDFLGFDYHEVSVESKSFQCQTRLCLVNHFQGRVSCPYGQAVDGTAVQGALLDSRCMAGCCTPGVPRAVTGPLVNGKPADMANGERVLGQCAQSRTADRAVYCSCRCANINGNQNDGANYCTCPDGFACTQLLSSIGAGNEGLTGGYCVKTHTEYNVNETCTPCNGVLKDCGAAPNQGIMP
jgi:hypothetical protein